MYSQTKTILLLISAFLITILFISGFVYKSATEHLNNEFYVHLEARAETVARIHFEPDYFSTEHSGNYNLTESLLLEQTYIVDAMDTNAINALNLESKLPFSFYSQTLREGEADFKIKEKFYKSILYKNSNKNYIVIVAAENHLEHKLRSYLIKILLFSIFATLLFSILFTIYSSRVFFKSIVEITAKVKQISSENLHLRLDDNHKNRELDELIKTFNDMLNRIATSFETQNNFISNASHELRTPLTAIIGEADVCLSKIRQPEEYVETLTIILDEAEKLNTKTKALLFLAQTGFNGKNQRFDKIRVDQLLWDVKETMEKINPNNNIQLDMSMLPENPFKLKVNGNEQLLHLALSNIIGNACKYSNYKEVSVSLGASDSHVFIIIKDLGIGIPQNELKYIYDLFYRASNTNKFEGYGIGMPLARNIIKMHKGKMIVHSIENTGTTVQIEIPAWSEKKVIHKFP